MISRRLATFGYGMNSKTSRAKADVFRDCLRAAGVSLLLDIRDSPWGGFWNPKKIISILDGTEITYLFKEDSFVWHKAFGASRELRNRLRRLGLPWKDFRVAYVEQLFERIPDVLEHLASLLDHEALVAIMCCEPFDVARQGCSLKKRPARIVA